MKWSLLGQKPPFESLPYRGAESRTIFVTNWRSSARSRAGGQRSLVVQRMITASRPSSIFVFPVVRLLQWWRHCSERRLSCRISVTITRQLVAESYTKYYPIFYNPQPWFVALCGWQFNWSAALPGPPGIKWIFGIPHGETWSVDPHRHFSEGITHDIIFTHKGKLSIYLQQ